MLINLTPHVVTIYAPDAHLNPVTIPPDPRGPARATEIAHPAGTVDGLPLVETEFGTVEGLPGPVGGTYYIVSQYVLAACPDRDDLLCPDTGPESAIRVEGRITGVRRLRRPAQRWVPAAGNTSQCGTYGGVEQLPELGSFSTEAEALQRAEKYCRDEAFVRGMTPLARRAR